MSTWGQGAYINEQTSVYMYVFVGWSGVQRIAYAKIMSFLTENPGNVPEIQ